MLIEPFISFMFFASYIGNDEGTGRRNRSRKGRDLAGAIAGRHPMQRATLCTSDLRHFSCRQSLFVPNSGSTKLDNEWAAITFVSGPSTAHCLVPKLIEIQKM